MARLWPEGPSRAQQRPDDDGRRHTELDLASSGEKATGVAPAPAHLWRPRHRCGMGAVRHAGCCRPQAAAARAIAPIGPSRPSPSTQGACFGRRGRTAPSRRQTAPTASSSGGGGGEDERDGDQPVESMWSSDSTASLRAAMQKAQAQEEYRSIVDTLQDGGDIDLLASALLLARHRYPDLNVAKYEGILADWTAAIELRLAEKEKYPMVVLRTISEFMFQDLGFTGNVDDYYSPDNSCINKVIETRKGIPITLSLVYLELARRMGVEMHGVNMPSHFLLRPAGEDLAVFVDVFHEGKVIFLEDAEELLSSLWGAEVKLDPVWVERNEGLPKGRWLTRILANLKNAYIMSEQPNEVLAIIQYIRLATPDRPEEMRDEGICYYTLGRYAESISSLQSYLQAAPKAGDTEKVMRVIGLAQAGLGGGAGDNDKT